MSSICFYLIHWFSLVLSSCLRKVSLINIDKEQSHTMLKVYFLLFLTILMTRSPRSTSILWGHVMCYMTMLVTYIIGPCLVVFPLGLLNLAWSTTQLGKWVCRNNRSSMRLSFKTRVWLPLLSLSFVPLFICHCYCSYPNVLNVNDYQLNIHQLPCLSWVYFPIVKVGLVPGPEWS